MKSLFISKFGLFILISSIILVAIALLATLYPYALAWGWEATLYHNIYTSISSGKLPYIDFFIEYPPFAPYVISFPWLFVANIPKNIFWGLYVFGIGFWLIGFFIIEYILLQKVGIAKQTVLKYLIVTMGLILICYNIVFTRYDIFPSILAVVSITCYLVYLKEHKFRWLFLTSVLLAIAFCIKIYPAILLPVIVIIEFLRRNYKHLLYFFIPFVLICCINLPFFIQGQEVFRQFLTFQTNRDIQIESTYAVPLFYLDKVDVVENQIQLQNGALEIYNDYAKTLGKFPFLIIVLSSALVYLSITVMFQKYLKKHHEQQRSIVYFQAEDLVHVMKMIVLSSFLLVLIFIIFNKVFSPQYLAWLIVFVPLFAFFDKPNDNKTFRQMTLLAVLIGLLTALIYPLSYDALIKQDMLMIIVLTIRNGLLLYILGYFSVALYRLLVPRHSQLDRESQ